MIPRVVARLSASLLLIHALSPRAFAHFGFNDGHPGAGLGILVFGGAIAVIGLLAYLAFFGKDRESEETEEDGR